MADETPQETPAVPEPEKSHEPIRDTGPLSSKKFIIAFWAVVSSKFIMFAGLWVIKDNVEAGSVWLLWWMIALTIIDGFVVVGTVMSIAHVDRYVRVASIMARNPGKPPIQNEG